jgi:hypothetical protein
MRRLRISRIGLVGLLIVGMTGRPSFFFGPL